MSDIFGRSTSRPVSGITKQQIASMIKKYVASGLNLVDVDPEEIVVFGDKQGKLKTSNLSLDDLLTKQPTAKDDSIAVFKAGKLEPSYDIKRFSDKFDTIDNINVNTTNAVKNLATLQSAFDAHVGNYATLRRNFNTADNAIEKFFGKKNIKPDEVTTTLPDLKKSIEDIKKVTDVNSITTIKQDITTVNYRLDSTIDVINVISSRLGVIRDTETASNLIAENKKSIEDLKRIIDKGVYTVDYGFVDFVQGMSLSNNRFGYLSRSNAVYRFSLISEYQFNIKIQAYDNNDALILWRGVNVVLFNLKDIYKKYTFDITPIDPTVVRARVYHILEFVF